MQYVNQEMVMSSRGKKKTTMAKLNREAKLRERRVEKQMRKDARHAAAGAPDEDLATDDLLLETDEDGLLPEGQAELEPVLPTPSEAS